MADLTKSIMQYGTEVAITSNAGAASQTIVWNRSDGNIFIKATNSDAAPATITFTAAGVGAPAAKTITLAQNATKGIFLESFNVKDPATQKVTATITNANGTAYSGTVTNVKIEVIEAPKALVD
jgi:hypothetical protein